MQSLFCRSKDKFWNQYQLSQIEHELGTAQPQRVLQYVLDPHLRYVNNGVSLYETFNLAQGLLG